MVVEYAGQDISGSPFSVFVFDANKAQLEHEEKMFVNDEGHFTGESASSDWSTSAVYLSLQQLT